MKWYDREIKEISNIKNDILTFGEVITKIENEFFNGYRLFKKPPEKRDRKHPSDKASWKVVYFQYYQHLPSDKQVNLKDIQDALSCWEQGTKSYKDAVSVMKILSTILSKWKFFGEAIAMLRDLTFPPTY